MTAAPEREERLARSRVEGARERHEPRERRGRLTIFFGAASGVGKTFAMLAAARAAVEDEARDVIVGVVESHGRRETAALGLGLDLLPRHGHDLDLDAALARKADLVLVDELAHTNGPGLRHERRWQDVEELLAAGSDVYTTLNVQHLESLNDVVAQITGVVERETVPDAVFEDADEVRLVDLPVDGLRDRAREKESLGDAADDDARGVFREGHLIALRELSLRRAAERVEAKMRSYKAAHGIDATWQTSERVLVCVSPSPTSERLVRAARRMAFRLHAELLAVYVETPASIRMSTADRERLLRHMRLAESLGAESVTLRGERASQETVAYARKRNVTKIVVGSPTHPRWRDVLWPSFLDEIVRASREIDVHVVSGLADRDRDRDRDATKLAAGPRFTTARHAPPSHFVRAAALVGAGTGVSWIVFGRAELADVVMVHLLAIVVVAMRYGYGPSIFATLASILAIDVLFVPPYFSLAVMDFRHVATFAVMFVVALTTSHLTRRVRDQADSAQKRERRTASLFSMGRELGGARSRDELLAIAARHAGETFDCEVGVHMVVDGARVPAADELERDDATTRSAIEWAFRRGKPAGLATDTLPTASALALPIGVREGSDGAKATVAVLALRPTSGARDETIRRLRDPDERQLLDTIGALATTAIERVQLEEDAREARLRAETERLRNALLSSVSHDLRTPLGVVTGATSALLDDDGHLGADARRELLQTAHDEAERLSRLVRNLLDMTRLEAGAIRPRTAPESVEEIVGSVLGRFTAREITTAIPPELLVACDSALLGQALINLVENAVKYSPAGAALHVEARASARGNTVEIDVCDRGAGVSDAEKARIFEKFYRAHALEGGGVGLGLTVARGIVEAHHGALSVHDRDGGGATFRVELPRADVAVEGLRQRPPEVPDDGRPSGAPDVPTHD